MLNETWKEQYDRMQRSFARLNLKNQHRDIIESRDILYHFCCDAFHLRDWIAATLGTDEATTKANTKQINQELIKASPELSACCDIANGFKHYVLHHKSYVTGAKLGHAQVVGEALTISMPMIIEHPDSGTADIAHEDGTWEFNVPLGSEKIAAAAREASWSLDTFEIDINGHKHDAHQVAAKAVAAWDQWLSGPSTIAAQLRST